MFILVGQYAVLTFCSLFVLHLFQGVITQLSEQISTLCARMDEFTSRIEELNAKFKRENVSGSQQNLASQAEVCNGSGPTSFFVSGLGNGSLTGSLVHNSSSSSQLAREAPLLEEVSSHFHSNFTSNTESSRYYLIQCVLSTCAIQVAIIARGQRQLMHHLDNLSNFVHENIDQTRQARPDRNALTNVEFIGVPLLLTLAFAGVGIVLFRLSSRN